MKSAESKTGTNWTDRMRDWGRFNPTSNYIRADGPSYTRSGNQGKKDMFGTALMVLQILTFLVCIWLVWQSVEVYVQFGAQLAQWAYENTTSSGLLGFLTRAWLIGGIFRWLVEGGYTLVCVSGALFLYGVLQVFEVAPLMLENSPHALRSIIAAIDSQSRILIQQDDHPTVANLKEKHNLIPTNWVDGIYTAKWIAYAIDFGICLFFCPPIRGGWERLGLVATAPQWSDLDLGNCFKIAVTLFAVEAAFFTWLWIRRGRKMLSGEAE